MRLFPIAILNLLQYFADMYRYLLLIILSLLTANAILACPHGEDNEIQCELCLVESWINLDANKVAHSDEELPKEMTQTAPSDTQSVSVSLSQDQPTPQPPSPSLAAQPIFQAPWFPISGLMWNVAAWVPVVQPVTYLIDGRESERENVRCAYCGKICWNDQGLFIHEGHCKKKRRFDRQGRPN